MALATPNLYRQNAFRILGLPATATTRTVATQVQKLQVLAGVGRVDPSICGPLPLQPPPGPEAIREADAKLHDPQVRILHEFFWFWPVNGADGADDPGFIALKSGDIAAAIRIWESIPIESRTHAIARHNQAVLWHLITLGLELRRSKEPADQPPSDSLLKQWPHVLKLWDEVVRSDVTWSTVAARVLAINDDRLSLEFAQAVRRTVAKALIQIHVNLALGYAESGSWTMAGAHLEWVLSAPLKLVSAGNFSKKFLEGTKSHFRRRVEDADKIKLAEPVKGGELAGQLLSAIEPYNYLFKLLEDVAEDATWHEIHDEVSEAVISCLYAFQNNKGDELLCVSLLKRALLISHSEPLRLRINEAISTVEGNIAHTLLQPYFELIGAIRESKSTPKVRLATFQHELEPKIPQACAVLDQHNQPRKEFLTVIGYLLRDISVDAWNQAKDARTASLALELAELYASADEDLRARLNEDRTALQGLTSAQRSERLRRLMGLGLFAGIPLVCIVISFFNEQNPSSHPVAKPQTQHELAPRRVMPGGLNTSESGAALSDETSLTTNSGKTYRVPASVVPELDQDRATLEQAQAQVGAARSSLDSKQAALDYLKSDLDTLAATLEAEKGIEAAGGSYAISQYNADVDRYNAKLTNYRRKVREFNNLVARHNELLAQANSLVDAFNAKLRRVGNLVGH
jgi:hypothetical protein